MRKNTITVNELKLSLIAEEIVMVNKFITIFENLFKSYELLNEADEDSENKSLTPEEEKAMDAIMQTLVDALKKEKSAVQSTFKDPDKIEDLEKKYDELGDLADTTKNEGKLNEFAITGSLIAGVVAAIPALIKILGYAVKGIGSMLSKFGFAKAGDKTKQFAEKLFHASEDLHHKYIKAVKFACKYMIPGFAEFEESTQEKMATVVYYVIIGILGFNAGVDALHSFKIAQWIPGGIEGVLTAIKGGEIGSFLSSALKSAIA